MASAYSGLFLLDITDGIVVLKLYEVLKTGGKTK